MAKKILLSFTFFLTIILSFGQSYIEIGSGTVEKGSPIYGSYDNSWSKMLYKSSELGGTKTITDISFNSSNGGGFIVNNQKIYFKLTTATTVATAYEEPVSSGYTLVYSGNWTITTGWNKIDITDFEYDGSKNLIVLYENRTNSSNYKYFYSSTAGTDEIKVNGCSAPPTNCFPTTNGFTPYENCKPNIRVYYLSQDPGTPANPIPNSNDLKVNVQPLQIQFDLGTNTNSYDLYFSPDQNKVTNSDASVKVVENATVSSPGTYSYNVPSSLSSKTLYYWKVVAKNSTASTSSPVWNFRTQLVNSTFPYNQDFNWHANGDNVFKKGWPEYFTEWYYTSRDINNYFMLAWIGGEEIQSTPADEDSLAYISPTSLNNGEYVLKSSRFDLTGNNGKHKINFIWKNGSSVITSEHTTYFEISIDGGATWTALATLLPSEALNEFVLETIDLTEYATNNVFFRWRYVRLGDGAVDVFLDNILVTEILDKPEINLSHLTYQFPELYVNGKTAFNIEISNTSTLNLVITGTQTTGDFTCNFAQTIAAGQKATAKIYFEPKTAGSLTGSVEFLVNGAFSGNNIINLSGVAFANSSLWFEAFDATAVNAVPQHWNTIKDANDINVWCQVKSEISNSGDRSFTLYNNDKLSSPLMVITPGCKDFDKNVLTFFARNSYSTSFSPVEIGVTDDPYNPDAFISVISFPLTASFTKYSVNFNNLLPGNTKPYIVFKHPNQDIMRKIYIDDVQWDIPNTTDPPGAASIVSPGNNAVNIPNMTKVTLKWSSGGGDVDYYLLYLGTNENADNIYNGVNVQLVTFKEFTNLDFNTKYYWKIVPASNENGPATGSTTWAFTTQSYPVITTFPYSESFETDDKYTGFDLLSEAPKKFPLGWSLENLKSKSYSWNVIKNNFTNFSHGEGIYAMHSFSDAMNSMEDYLYTPPLRFYKNKKYEVSFWYMTSVIMAPTEKEKMQVAYGIDNVSAAVADNIVWNIENNYLDNRSHLNGTFTIEPFIPDGQSYLDYYIAFISLSDANQGILAIDDITITESTLTSVPSSNTLQFIVYPNPSAGEFNVQLPKLEINSFISVFNSLGQVIYSQKINAVNEHITLANATKGVYFVKVLSGNNTFNAKLIID